MKIFHGHIVAASEDEGTVTIEPDGGNVNGIVIGQEVNIVPVQTIGAVKEEREPGE